MGLTTLGYSVDKCVAVNDKKIQWALSNATNVAQDPFPYFGETKEICIGKNKQGEEYIFMSAEKTGRVVFTSGKNIGKYKDLVAGVSHITTSALTKFRDFEPIKRAILGQK